VNDIEMMRVALDAARKAVASQDIPVGAEYLIMRVT